MKPPYGPRTPNSIVEVLSQLPKKWFQFTEAEKQELERAIVMDKLARSTTFNLGPKRGF